jgi:peptide/nickel transport system substrate-binding protein
LNKVDGVVVRRILKSVAMKLGMMLACVLALATCGTPSDVDVPLTLVPSPTPATTVIAPTPEPPPPKTLVVCLNQEPSSLYIYSDAFLYGAAGREANAVLQAIYDGPFDILDYQVQPVILERTPNLSEGVDALIEEVAVAENEIYFDPQTFKPENLKTGKPYLPAGCDGPACIEMYEGGEVLMTRMVVDFHLKPGLVWSDGEALTAMDSVFSFHIDQDGDTPTTKYLVDRTYSYEALDELSVRWTGIPGFMDKEYATNFWSPLPQHILGEYLPSELLTLDDANKAPIGWGPYRIESWQEGEQIALQKNPNYSRGAEGLPYFDTLLFRFLGGDTNAAIQQVMTGECDLLDESLLSMDGFATLHSLEGDGRLKVHWSVGAELMRLDFNLDTNAGEPIFSDTMTRQAIAACIDRQGIVDDLLYGMSLVPETYLSPEHPDYKPDLDPIRYDVESANTMFEEAGWLDMDGDVSTPRVAQSVPGVSSGTELSFTFTTSPSQFHTSLAERLQDDLKACGVEMKVEYANLTALHEAWPDGKIFGREFEVVGWTWLDWLSPICEMFAEREIPSEDHPFGSNASGFKDSEYNEACDKIFLSPPGSGVYREAVEQTQTIFNTQLPAIPLYLRPRLLITRSDFCGIRLDTLEFSELWNLEGFDFSNTCEE